MKKRTVYIWMGAMVVLSAAIFTVITFFHLQSDIKPMIASANPAEKPEFKQSIYGNFENPLKKPMDVSKINGNLYVTDTQNQRIQVFDTSGKPLFKFGKAGSGKGEFQFPYGIAGDKENHVYVADMYTGNISIFDAKGKFIKYFPDPKKLIQSPGGLRIFDDKLYVTDIKQNKVYVFTLAGKKLMEIGGPGADNGKFLAPNAVTADRAGQIYVSDSGNNRVQVFDKNGKFLKIINGSKDGKGQAMFINPRGVAVNSQGTVYIVSNMTHNIYAFDASGKQVQVLGGMGTDEGQLYLPNGLFIDDRDTLFVTDTLNQRISVFY